MATSEVSAIWAPPPPPPYWDEVNLLCLAPPRPPPPMQPFIQNNLEINIDMKSAFDRLPVHKTMFYPDLIILPRAGNNESGRGLGSV
jgi:hypothetical protein